MNNQGRSLLRLVDADSQSTADKWHLIAVAHLRVRRRRRQTEPNNKSRSETKHEKNNKPTRQEPRSNRVENKDKKRYNETKKKLSKTQ